MAAEANETMRATHADFTIMQNLFILSQSQADIIGNLTEDRARAIAAEVSLRAALDVTNAALDVTNAALDVTNAALIQSQSTAVESQKIITSLQYNNSMLSLAFAQMRAVAVCSGRGMFADMDGVCFSASTSQSSGSGTCSNSSDVVFTACKPGFAPQSHTTPTCGAAANGVYPTSFTCVGIVSLLGRFFCCII